MKKQNKFFIFILLNRFSLLALGWCFFFHPIGLASPQTTLHFAQINEKNLEEQPLPENFVSVGIKIPNGSYRHLVGGFLIHPGVVVTSWHHSEYYYLSKKSGLLNINHGTEDYSYSLDRSIRERKLYVVFHLQNKEKKSIAFKVRKVVGHPSGTSTPTHHTIELLFFEPDERISHVLPLPLATTKDVKNFHDLVDDDFLWAVGVRDHPISPPHRHPQNPKKIICPTKSKSRLGKVSVPYTPADYEWMSYLFNIFPGNLRPYLAYSSPPTPSSLLQQEANLSFIQTCSHIGFFCTQFQTPRIPINKYLSFQCTEHIGYPVLWRSPSGTLKALGITTLSPYQKVRKRSDTVAWPQPLRSQHFNLMSAHEWIDAMLRSYAQEDLDQFTVNEGILDTWDQSLKKVLEEGRKHHLDFIANIVTRPNEISQQTRIKLINQCMERKKSLDIKKLEKTCSDFVQRVIRNFNCRGTLIGKGVVLTAGHCLMLSHQDPILPLYVVFKIKDQEYSTKIKQVKLLPEYLEFSQRENKNILDYQGGDLGLAFYDHTQDLPEIKPASLELDPSKERQKLDKAINTKSKLFLSARHRIRSIEGSEFLDGQDSEFLEYRWIPLDFGRRFSDFLSKKVSNILSSEVKKKKIFSEIEKISQEPIIESKIIGRLKDFWSETSNFILFYITHFYFFCSADNVWVCAWADKELTMLERHSVACAGDSGSPVLWKDASQKPIILGVAAHASSTSESGVYGCSHFFSYNRLSPYRDWILSAAFGKKL